MNPAQKIILSSLIAFFFLPSYAQEMKTKKILTGNCQEIFTIDKKSKLKNGEYLKLDIKSRDTLVSGTFRDDLKTGVWKYNCKASKPWITYDYDKKILNPISEEITEIDSFMIKKDNVFVSEKVDAPPVYLGYKDELKNTLGMYVKVPITIMTGQLSVISIASFTVDKNGKMKDFEIAQTLSDEVDNNIRNAFKKLDGEWTPAFYNGQPVESIIFVVFEIKPKEAPSAMPKISNAIELQFNYFGVTRTVTKRVVSVRRIPSRY